MHLNKLFRICLLFFILGTILPGKAAFSYTGQEVYNWNRWKGPGLDNISPETGWDKDFLKKNLKINWKASIGAGYANISVMDSYIYTSVYYDHPVNENVLLCMDPATGGVVWKYRMKLYPGQWMLTKATPVVDEGMVYSFSQDGKLYCNDAFTGKLIWSLDLMSKYLSLVPKWQFASSVHIEGDIAVISACRAGIAFNKKTGKIAWNTGLGAGCYATPVPFRHNNTGYLAIFGKGYLYGVEVKSGKIAWAFPWQTEDDYNAADPAIYGDKIFISTGYEKGCALLDISSGKPVELWSNKNMRAHIASPVIIGDFVYGIDGDPIKKSYLVCLDLKDGSVRWKSPKHGFRNFTASNGYLILVDREGSLVMVKADPGRYTEISKKDRVTDPNCFTAPVICRSTLYLKSLKGTLTSIDMHYRKEEKQGFFAAIKEALRSFVDYLMHLFGRSTRMN